MEKGLVLWGVRSIFYVEDSEGKEYKCVIKSKRLDSGFDLKGRNEASPIVAGDYVMFEKTSCDEGVILQRLPRKNEFTRLKAGGRVVQTLVANVDWLIVVDSVVSPPLRPFFIDRCLFTADLMNIKAMIVFNKFDLLDGEDPEEFKRIRQTYEDLGYPTLVTSTVTGQGIEELRNILKDKTCSFNGRSGVGKSTLVRTIDPELENKKIQVGEVSRKFNRGTHTTTRACAYRLSFGGRIIDTPGVREFSVFLDKPEELAMGFRDFRPYCNCRFSDCQHIQEPDCGIRKALEDGKINDFRYESYLRMRETVLKLSDAKMGLK